MIVVAGLVPVVVELVSQAAPRLRGGSFTPVVFAFTGMLVAWGLFRYRMFDVVPLARDLVFENMIGLVFMVDANGRVADLNPAAQRAVIRLGIAIQRPEIPQRSRKENAWCFRLFLVNYR